MSLAVLAHGEPSRREPDARPTAAYRVRTRNDPQGLTVAPMVVTPGRDGVLWDAGQRVTRGRERRQPRPRHPYLSRVGEDLSGLREIGGHRSGTCPHPVAVPCTNSSRAP